MHSYSNAYINRAGLACLLTGVVRHFYAVRDVEDMLRSACLTYIFLCYCTQHGAALGSVMHGATLSSSSGRSPSSVMLSGASYPLRTPLWT